MNKISSSASIVILCLSYTILLLLFAYFPSFRVFHCIFAEGENEVVQMAFISIICLLISLVRAPSVLYIIVACLAPYGMISAMIAMGTSAWGLAVNLAAFFALPVLYWVIKEPRSDPDQSLSISEKTLSDIAEESSGFIGWAVFPIYTIFAVDLAYVVIAYII